MVAVSRSASVLVSADNAGDAERTGADRNNHSAAAAAFAILLVFVAAVAFADDKDDAAKLKAFRDLNPDSAKSAKGQHVEFHFPYVELHYFGMDWRLLYLPFLAPLPGASLKDAGTIPNAFEQLGMQNAPSTLPPAFNHDRSAAVEKEYKRIEKLSKQAQVVVSASDGSH